MHKHIDMSRKQQILQDIKWIPQQATTFDKLFLPIQHFQGLQQENCYQWQMIRGEWIQTSYYKHPYTETRNIKFT